MPATQSEFSLALGPLHFAVVKVLKDLSVPQNWTVVEGKTAIDLGVLDETP